MVTYSYSFAPSSVGCGAILSWTTEPGPTTLAIMPPLAQHQLL